MTDIFTDQLCTKRFVTIGDQSVPSAPTVRADRRSSTNPSLNKNVIDFNLTP